MLPLVFAMDAAEEEALGAAPAPNQVEFIGLPAAADDEDRGAAPFNTPAIEAVGAVSEVEAAADVGVTRATGAPAAAAAVALAASECDADAAAGGCAP